MLFLILTVYVGGYMIWFSFDSNIFLESNLSKSQEFFIISVIILFTAVMFIVSLILHVFLDLMVADAVYFSLSVKYAPIYVVTSRFVIMSRVIVMLTVISGIVCMGIEIA